MQLLRSVVRFKDVAEICFGLSNSAVLLKLDRLALQDVAATFGGGVVAGIACGLQAHLRLSLFEPSHTGHICILHTATRLVHHLGRWAPFDHRCP